MDDGAAAEARRWAEEILAARWAAERFRLELADEQWAHHRVLGRPTYQARFQVWEAAGAARVRLDREGRAFAAGFPWPGGAEAADDPLPAAWRAVAEAAGLEVARTDAGQDRPLRVRSSSARIRRGCADVRVELERAPDDGHVVIDLDPRGRSRLGYLCVPFFRGSTRSAALSRRTIVERARQALPLPASARLTRARLTRARLGRAWRLRWEVDEPEREGVILATLNGRSGALCAAFSLVGPRRPAHLEPRPPRAEAAEELALAVRVRLGSRARVGALVEGVVGRGEQARAAWLAAVRDGRGRVYRAALAGGRLRLRRCG